MTFDPLTQKQIEAETISSPLYNAYGRVEVRIKKSGKCHMILNNYDGPNKVKISREFFEAFKKEFGHDV